MFLAGGVRTSTFISQRENLYIPRGIKGFNYPAKYSVAAKFSVCMGHAPMVEVKKKQLADVIEVSGLACM